jgi:hypothetical protein
MVWTGSGGHTASCSLWNKVPSWWGEGAWAWCWPLPSSAEFQKDWNLTPTPPMILWSEKKTLPFNMARLRKINKKFQNCQLPGQEQNAGPPKINQGCQTPSRRSFRPHPANAFARDSCHVTNTRKASTPDTATALILLFFTHFENSNVFLKALRIVFDVRAT